MPSRQPNPAGRTWPRIKVRQRNKYRAKQAVEVWKIRTMRRFEILPEWPAVPDYVVPFVKRSCKCCSGRGAILVQGPVMDKQKNTMWSRRFEFCPCVARGRARAERKRERVKEQS